MKMWRDVELVFIIAFFAVCRSTDVATSRKLEPEKVCLLKQDVGLCYRDFDKKWFYDSKLHICRVFLFGGCGGNENRFDTEADCYALCKEKLVLLHPPEDVTIGYTQHDTVFIYWYRPENYELHVENDTSTGFPVTGAVTVTPEMLSPTSSVKSTGVNSISTNAKTVSNIMDVTTQSLADSTNVTTNSTINSTNLNSDSEISTVTTLSVNSVTKNSSHVTETNSTNMSGGLARDKTASDLKWNVTLEGGVNLNLSDYIGKNPVPFHFAKLKHYVLSYRKQGAKVAEDSFTNETVMGNKTEFEIKGLVPSSDYMIVLTAVYLTNTSVPAPAIMVKTRRDPSAAKECHCDPHGTIGGYHTCNLSISQMPWCQCKTGYSGLFCEICSRGFYRITPSLPCHRCPCSEITSTQSCFFVDSYLHCTECKQEYAGQHCQRCANGYHRDVATTHCKKCEGCHNIKPGLICDPFTGQCLNCHYNTTGHKCENCLEGFVGDPSKNIPCVAVADQKGYTPPPSGLIAAIVIAIIVVLSLIIGCIVYRRMRAHPTMKPFWTIELKQDHESVNFSSVPDQDWENLRDDELLHEKPSKSKTKNQPYLQLKEDI